MSHFPSGSFGDGGYLDNKPFSHAIDALVTRHAEVPVERKLIYVEPAPDHPEDTAPLRRQPDAIENSLAALVEIPGYETIRGDLQTVLERNRGMERVSRILKGVEREIEAAIAREGVGAGRNLPVSDWARLDVREIVERFGLPYLAYTQLKVSSVTDDLTTIFARVFRFDADSAFFRASRCLVRAWRNANYVEDHDGDRPTQNQFLLDFDVAYRLRRIRFVLNKIDELATVDDNARRILALRRQNGWLDAEPAELTARIGMFQRELTEIKEELTLRVYRPLRTLERQLWARPADSPLIPLADGLTITLEDLTELIADTGVGSEDECTARAATFLREHPEKRDQLDRIAGGLREMLRDRWAEQIPGRDRMTAFRLARPEAADTLPAAAARVVVHHYFSRYDDYDVVLFPILFQTDILGEGATVDVIRLSPEDSRSLMDDRAEAHKPRPLRKLAGITLAHFGGFLEREWRRNDMMWGRLDAAERLITTILPDPDVPARRAAIQAIRQQLIDEAQRSIIREELDAAQRTALFRQVAASGAGAPTLALARRILLDEKGALEHYRETLERRPDPERAVRAIARGAQVVGKILEGIAKRREMDTRRIALLTRLGQLFWGLVEVATPQSAPQLFFRYWLQLVYAFAVVMIVGGVLAKSDVQRVGWILLGGTAAVHLAALLLSDYMLRSWGWLKAVKLALVVCVLGLAAVGGFTLWSLARHLPPLEVTAGDAILSRTRLEWMVSALGIVTLALIVVGLSMDRRARSMRFVATRRRTSSGIARPILACELAESPADVRAIVGDVQSPDRSTMATIQKIDFVFIGLYWVLFTGLAVLMARNAPELGGLATIAFATGTFAGLFDIIENVRTLRLLKQPLPAVPPCGGPLQQAVDSIRRAALTKWGLFFITLILLAPVFAGPSRWGVVLSLWFGCAGVVGLLGLRAHRMLIAGSALFGMGLVALAALFSVAPGAFLAR